jgi:tetratricopeptide repeat protein
VRAFVEILLGDRRARLIALVALGALAAALYFLPTSTGQEAANNRLGAYVCAGVFALVAILEVAVEIRQASVSRANFQGEAEMRAALRSPGVMPIPPLPKQLSKIQRERQPQVEGYVRQLKAVPWGQQVSMSGSDVRPAFDRAVTVTRRIAGDWGKLGEPIQIFAAMPAPWCYIGAAEVMHRLSFLVGGVFSPVGLRQGLRFIAQAQAVDPDNADALITRARLLSGMNDPYWLNLAGDTLARARTVAPNHFRLPASEAAYYNRLGQKERALACIEESIARAPTPTDRTIAQFTYADTLLDMGRNDEAVVAYRTLLETEASDPWLWHNLSIALYNLQRYDEALDCNQRVLSIMQFNAARVRGDMIRKKLAERASGGYSGGNPGGYA